MKWHPFILLLIFSCSHRTVTKRETETHLPKRPEWVTGPGASCPGLYLCAVGEGVGTMAADARARVELAQIFSTKVTSTTRIHSDLDSKEGKTQESFSRELSETTDEVLQGAQIHKRFYDEKEGVYYALARLKKGPAREIFLQKIKSLDGEIDSDYRQGKRLSLGRAIKRWRNREAYLERLLTLGGQAPTPPVDYQAILKKKADFRGLLTPVCVDVEAKVLKRPVRNLLVSLLTENDYLATPCGKPHSFKIKGVLKMEKVHLNVKGFEKFRFDLKVVSSQTAGATKGSLSSSFVEVGRNVKQASEVLLPKVRGYLRKNFTELKLD